MPIRSTAKSETYYDFFSASGTEVPFVYPTFNSNGERGIVAGGSPTLSQS